MPRKSRIPAEYMHIVTRGIGKQILFEENKDNRKYLFYLKKYSSEMKIKILAYCLMENHVHILIHDSTHYVSKFMKKIGISYAQYYNRKYDRTGHLFQDRFRSENIVDDKNLLSVFRYILNNPSKAGGCNADEYPWSSYFEYSKVNSLTETEIFQKMIGDKVALHNFLLQDDKIEHIEADVFKKDDKWALKTLREVLKITSGTELQKYDRKQRDKSLVLLKKNGLSIRQIERLTGINRGLVLKAN